MFVIWFLFSHLFFYTIQTFIISDNSYVNTTVNTNCGAIRGIWSQKDGAFSFRGIPYASPPVGDLRWQPPVAMRNQNKNCWQGTFEADTFGSECVQWGGDNNSNVVGNEDCLFLNVFTPTLNPSTQLPVMFWIHGGSLTSGNGSTYGYAPTEKLAKSFNVVFVSLNYRLQAFGFLALDWLKDISNTNTSGNYGLMDLIEGLRWVQENIHNFGGNPNDVTVFGQSSGGTAMIALLASPLCKGLFHKAWMMSASPVMNKTAPDAFRDNEVFIKNTGCPDVNCLLNLTSEAVTMMSPWDVYPYWSMDDQLALPEKGRFDGALAIVDGYVLPESPFEAWAKGNGVDVPVLIGTTGQEVDIGLFNQGISNWTWDTDVYRNEVMSKLSSFGYTVASTALGLYPEKVSTPEFQYTSMISDVRVACGNDYLATIIAAGFTSPVYRYVATYYSKNHSSEFAYDTIESNYAFHGIDVTAFFSAMDTYMDRTPSQRDRAWEQNVQNEAMHFVKVGKPAKSDWLPYPGVTAELDVTTKVFRGYHSAQCEFWLQNGFFAYSWIN